MDHFIHPLIYFKLLLYPDQVYGGSVCQGCKAGIHQDTIQTFIHSSTSRGNTAVVILTTGNNLNETQMSLCRICKTLNAQD